MLSLTSVCPVSDLPDLHGGLKHYGASEMSPDSLHERRWSEQSQLSSGTVAALSKNISRYISHSSYKGASALARIRVVHIKTSYQLFLFLSCLINLQAQVRLPRFFLPL